MTDNPADLYASKNKVLAALKRVKAGEIVLPNQGICYNVESHLVTDELGAPNYSLTVFLIDQGSKKAVVDYLNELSQKWPKHSGNFHYPVPAPMGTRSSALGFYSACPNKWEGEYGELRYELLDFLIKELKQCQS